MTDVIPDQLCPYCGYHVNRASNIADRSLHPKAGDLIICLDCGEALVFKDDMSGIRKPTDAERVEIRTNTEYQDHLSLWKVWKQYYGRRTPPRPV